MNDELNGSDLLSKYAEVSDNDYEAAGMLLDELGVRGKARRTLVWIVAQSMKMARRHEQRGVERRVRIAAPILEGVPTHDQVQNRKDLIAGSFSLGDGRRVSWGKATVEQHRERIAYLAKLRDGYNVTISQHESAIALIVKNGVSCLSECVEWAA